MATYTPPTEILPIFDSSVYQGDQTGLTVSTGDARYLKFPTAQGLETFNAGLNTTSIGSTLTSIKYLWNTIAGAILIGDQSSLIGLGSTTTNTQIQNIESSSGTRRKLWMTNTDRIDIGSASTLINIGDSPATASSISIGDNLSTTYIPGTVSCGLLTTSALSINSIQPKAGIDTVNLYNTTSTAQINLGTQANRSAILNLGDGTDSTGGVHINNGIRATGNTQIMNGANASGTLNLGSSAVGNTVVINVNRPLTVGYTPPANLLANLVYMGGIWSATSVFTYTIGTTSTAYAPLNGLPNGRYLFQVYVFMPGTTPTQVNILLCDSTSAISNAQVSGLSVIYGGNEAYTSTVIGTNISVNPFFQHDVVSPKSNVALACSSGATLSGSSVFTLKAIRIG